MLLISSLALELSLESIEASSDGVVSDSSALALRDVVLVCVRVSVLDAPERSLVTAPISELVPVAGSLVAADGVLDGEVLDGEVVDGVELGFVLLLPYDGVAVDEEGEGIVELGLLVLGEDSVVVVVVVLVELLELEDGVLEDELESDDGSPPSAVRHSLLRCVSVVELESVAESLPLIELGVFVALGVFCVEDSDGVACVVVDSAVRVCSSTVRCCDCSPCACERA